jgi:general secretion pathway protein D
VTATQANPPRLERVEIQRAGGLSPGAFVTTLEQQSATINTTVSIPDGGTVLLGGVKLAGEVEIEAGIPILSKIPILKRAFTNATTVKDVMTLLILMKAKIIIQKEAEEEAFPTLSRVGAG